MLNLTQRSYPVLDFTNNLNDSDKQKTGNGGHLGLSNHQPVNFKYIQFVFANLKKLEQDMYIIHMWIICNIWMHFNIFGMMLDE